MVGLTGFVFEGVAISLAMYLKEAIRHPDGEKPKMFLGKPFVNIQDFQFPKYTNSSIPTSFYSPSDFGVKLSIKHQAGQLAWSHLRRKLPSA